MPYLVEVMGLGEDIYPLLKRATDALNGIQDQFQFQLTSAGRRAAALKFQRDEYDTAEIWRFLRTEKKVGMRPFIIAFVTNPLRSSKFSNIFGAHEGQEGMAVATMFDARQYVREEMRYCCYYLVRYALSFVNWELRAHEDAARADCYFHFKRRKQDLRLSMDSGRICDRCMQQLDNPSASSSVNRLSLEEREALDKMRQYVSENYPYALVMKGGGIKGLAAAGALIELGKHFWFDRHVGTSAGAIGAILLAAGYTPTDVRDLLLKKDFRDFLDAPLWKIPFNFILKRGFFPGEAFRIWIADLLTKKVGRVAEVKMKDLNGALIYAARDGEGALKFDSTGERQDTVASFAARCSMSIPVFFTPTTVDGRRVYDGGLRHNFPLKRFLDDHSGNPVIAIYLGKANNSNKRWFGLDMLNIVIDGEERQLVDQRRRDVVVIDTSPVGTVDFGLTEIEKEFLLSTGKAAALRFLFDRNLDKGPSQSEVEQAESQAETYRDTVSRNRALRKTRRWIVTVLVAGLLAVAAFLARRMGFWF